MQLLRLQVDDVNSLPQEGDRLIAALRSLPSAVVITDLGGIIRAINPALSSLSGYTAAEAVGQPLTLLSCRTAEHSLRETLQHVVRSAEPFRGEWVCRRRDGDPFSAMLAASSVSVAGGEPLFILVTIEDITSHKQVQEELRLTRERLEATEQTAATGTWSLCCATGAMDVSTGWLKLHGLAQRRTIPEWEAFTGILHPEDRVRLFSQYEEQLGNRSPNLSVEYRIVQHDGEIRWIRASGRCTYDRRGLPLRIDGVCVDSTERTRVDELATEAQRDFERFFNLIPDLACIVSTDGYFKKVNPAWETTLGYTQEEVLSTPMLGFIHPDDLQRTLDEVAKQGPEYRTRDFVNRYRRKDGSYRVFHWRTTFNRDESTRFGVAKDITDQLLWEESLRESEERFRTMADSCPVIIWVTDAAGRTRLANRICTEFFGCPFEQADEDSSRLLIHPEDHSEYVGKFLDAVRERAPFRAEARVRRSDGEWCWIASYAEPRLSQSGEFLGHVGISPDITDRKQSEEELQTAKDAAESANHAKSEFLANMSHEIRTPMNGVIGLTQLALATDLTAEQREYLEGVGGSARSLLRILNDILDFSKIEAGKLEFEVIEFDLRRTIEEIVKLFGVRAAAKNLELACDLAPGVPALVLGDPVRLRQILLNLVGNAIKFTDRGEVVIRVDLSSHTADYVELHFSVTDTGIGIPLSKQQHVFSAFAQADSSSTRTHGGTGLGLTISSQLVERMGGTIWLESEEGRGSAFHFTVRLGNAASRADRETAAPAAGSLAGQPVLRRDAGEVLQTGNEERPPLRFLVVEDNPVNRLVVTRMIEKQNHTVRTAANGMDALEALEREPFDCVLMDVQMPVLDGFAATAAIRGNEQRLGGHVPIVAMTAHAMTGDLERCLAAGMDGYVSKPIDIGVLFATVDRVLQTLKLHPPFATEVLRTVNVTR